MPTLSTLKNELEFNTDLVALLEVMKGIAASRFQALQKRKERFRKFADSFQSFFELIDFSQAEHPFSRASTKRVGIVMVTSDEGFMGGLNTHVINSGLAERKSEAELMILGERGAAYLKGMNEKFIPFPGVTEENKYELALKLKDYIMEQSKSHKIGKVVLSYPVPVSFTFQKIEVVKLLPCAELFEKQKTEDRRQRTEDRGQKTEDRGQNPEKVIIESSMDAIIEHLVGEWITQKLYEVFEDSKLSEFAARTINLEQSHQNLSQSREALRYKYFSAKHSFVDKGMRETFASQLLRRRKS
jgi:F-type H+-transporting ATPase subunit gamma